MKKLLCLLFIIIMSVSFIACDKDSNSEVKTNTESEQKTNAESEEKTNTESEPTSDETLEKCPEDKNGIHDWFAANCQEPAKCSECDMYKDDVLGNHDWDTANCMSPATCWRCGECKDDKLGSHKWEDTPDERECCYCGMLYKDYVDIQKSGGKGEDSAELSE